MLTLSPLLLLLYAESNPNSAPDAPFICRDPESTIKNIVKDTGRATIAFDSQVHNGVFVRVTAIESRYGKGYIVLLRNRGPDGIKLEGRWVDMGIEEGAYELFDVCRAKAMSEAKAIEAFSVDLYVGTFRVIGFIRIPAPYTPPISCTNCTNSVESDQEIDETAKILLSI